MHHNTCDPTECELRAQGGCLSRGPQSRPDKVLVLRVIPGRWCWTGKQGGEGGKAVNVCPPVGYTADTWGSAPLGPFEKL